MGNDVDLWEMGQICGEMTIFWETASNCGKWLRNFENGQNIFEMA